MSAEADRSERRFSGIPVFSGIARGVAWVNRFEEETVPHYHVPQSRLNAEVERFEGALNQTRSQIEELQHRIAESVGGTDAGIFEAHLLMVEDRALIDEVIRTVRRDLLNVESVFSQVAARYVRAFNEMDDPYLKERATDIQDVARRVMRNLAGKDVKLWAESGEPHILVAHNLTPSETAQLNRRLVLGFATDVGSKTSHTAIMARSLGIPAVVGLHDISEQIESGAVVLLDGYNGLVVVNPTEATLEEYQALQEKKGEVEQRLLSLRETESKTRDGRHIALSANIESPNDVPLVLNSGAEGVGLFRTEYFYLNSEGMPDEETQYAAYRSVVEPLAPHSVIIRTLDLGGDKVAACLNAPKEENPFLGWRAIRVCLEQPEIFKPQLRAILRAGVHGNIRLMYPMISGVDEVRRANALLEECRKELAQEGKVFAGKIEVGAMIEIPSAAISADLIAAEVDFFSIGTNDLIQYSVAVDRLNDRIAHLYEPTHPAIVRLIRMVVEAARGRGIWTGVCGEMAGDVVFTPLLLGLGVEELSTGPSQLPRVKRAVQSLDLGECRKLVEEISGMDSPLKIYKACERMARECYPDLF
jgi:phosphotransferase system enzyme I (PtsI)